MTATAYPSPSTPGTAHVAMRSDGKWLAVAGDHKPVYWCVVCAKPLLTDLDGLYLHDPIEHPTNMIFDEEERPQ